MGLLSFIFGNVGSNADRIRGTSPLGLIGDLIQTGIDAISSTNQAGTTDDFTTAPDGLRLPLGIGVVEDFGEDPEDSQNPFNEEFFRRESGAPRDVFEPPTTIDEGRDTDLRAPPLERSPPPPTPNLGIPQSSAGGSGIRVLETPGESTIEDLSPQERVAADPGFFERVLGRVVDFVELEGLESIADILVPVADPAEIVDIGLEGIGRSIDQTLRDPGILLDSGLEMGGRIVDNIAAIGGDRLAEGRFNDVFGPGTGTTIDGDVGPVDGGTGIDTGSTGGTLPPSTPTLEPILGDDTTMDHGTIIQDGMVCRRATQRDLCRHVLNGLSQDLGRRISARDVKEMAEKFGLNHTAACLGVGIQTVCTLILCVPKRRRRGITARQISTARRVKRQVTSMARLLNKK